MDALPILGAILIVAIFIFIAINLTGKRTRRLDIEAYQTRFLAIENRLNEKNPATFITTVMDGDKLLDKALIELGIPGKTMGERLKKSTNRFQNINAVWSAHKLRNAVAHEEGLEITYGQAANALKIYKQALKDLGAI